MFDGFGLFGTGIGTGIIGKIEDMAMGAQNAVSEAKLRRENAVLERETAAEQEKDGGQSGENFMLKYVHGNAYLLYLLSEVQAGNLTEEEFAERVADLEEAVLEIDIGKMAADILGGRNSDAEETEGGKESRR